MAAKKKKSADFDVPYGLTKGEYEARGSLAKWKRGKFRKEAEAWRAKGGSIDANESDEDNIREKQGHLKNAAAWKAKQDAQTKKRVGGSAKAAGPAKKTASKKTTRKRVAGK